MHNVASFCVLYVLLKVFMYLFVYVCMVILLVRSSMNHFECQRLMEARKKCQSPGPRLTGCCESPIWVLGTESQTLCKSSECFLLLSHVFSPYAIVLPLLLARPLFSCTPVVAVTVGRTCKSEMGSIELDVRQWL